MNLLPVWRIREVADKVTNVVMNYSEVEARVRQATNDDAWGPAGALMQELARDTFMYECFPEVMGMLWKRMLHEGRKNWRRIYKALLLLSYLVRNGSERVVTSSREHLYDLKSLQDYTCYDEQGKDQGINVRNKVKDIISLVQDSERLRDERKKAKKTRNKYVGMSSDDMKFQSNRSAGNNYDREGGWRDTEDDYEDYSRRGRRDSNASANKYSDETADAERKSSDKISSSSNITVDKTESKMKSVIRNTVGKSEIKVSKKVDLGAAAHYTGGEPGSAAAVATTTSVPPQQTSAPKSQDLLDDIFDSVPPAQATSNSSNVDFMFGDSPVATAPSATATEDFASFGKAPPASTGGADDFADFASFQSPAAPAAPVAAAPVQFDPFASLTSSSSAPALAPTVAAAQQPASLLMGGLMMPSSNTTANFNQSLMQQPPASNSMNQFMQSNNLFGNPAGQQQQQPAAANSFMSAGFGGQPMMPNISSANMMMSSSNNGTGGSNASSKAAVNNTWSNIGGINISLESLGKPEQKQHRPTMNQLQQGGGVQQSASAMMSNLNLNSGGAQQMMQQQQQRQPQGMMMMMQPNNNGASSMGNFGMPQQQQQPQANNMAAFQNWSQPQQQNFMN